MIPRFFLLIVAIISFVNIAYSQDELIATVAPSSVPYGWIEGDEAVGPSVEIMKIIFADYGISVKPINVPWARSLAMLKDGDIDAILTIIYGEERTQYADFTIPYAEMDISVFVKKGNAFPFEKWEDLIPLKGISIRGDSSGEKFDNFAESRLKIQRVTTMEQVYQILISGRADYGVYPKNPNLIESMKLGYSDKIEILPVPISSQKIYFAFSKKSKFRKYLPEVNKKIKQLRDDGTIDNLIEKAIRDAADR